MSKDRYQIWVSQLFGSRSFIARGWLSQACDGLVDDRSDSEAGVFSMEEVTAILSTLSYDGCVLDEVRIENTHQPGEES